MDGHGIQRSGFQACMGLSWIWGGGGLLVGSFRGGDLGEFWGKFGGGVLLGDFEGAFGGVLGEFGLGEFGEVLDLWKSTGFSEVLMRADKHDGDDDRAMMTWSLSATISKCLCPHCHS